MLFFLFRLLLWSFVSLGFLQLCFLGVKLFNFCLVLRFVRFLYSFVNLVNFMLMYITYTVHITYNTLNSTSNKGVKRLRRIGESIHDSFPCSGFAGYMVSLNDSSF